MKKLLLIAIAALAMLSCEKFSTAPEEPGKEVLFEWSEIEPLGGYFHLQLKGFKGDTITSYVNSSGYDSNFVVYDNAVIPKNDVSQTIYIEVNFHYARDLTLFVYRNNSLFATTNCFPDN